MQFQVGDILAVHGNSFISEGIEIVTHSPICHVAVVVDTTNLQAIEAQGFRNVGYVPVSDYAGECVILRVPNLSEEKKQKIVEYLTKQIGKPYDYVSIFKEFERYVFDKNVKNTENDSSFICSSLVAAAFLFAGIQLTSEALASPNDIYVSKVVENVGRY